MNPLGANLTDIWTDIPIVRHRKYKPPGRATNTLSTKLLDRVVEISTKPGDLIFDPFGGAGTTCAVAEQKHRRWIGVELYDAQVIVDRLTSGLVAHHANTDIIEGRSRTAPVLATIGVLVQAALSISAYSAGGTGGTLLAVRTGRLAGRGVLAMAPVSLTTTSDKSCRLRYTQ